MKSKMSSTHNKWKLISAVCFIAALMLMLYIACEPPATTAEVAPVNQAPYKWIYKDFWSAPNVGILEVNGQKYIVLQYGSRIAIIPEPSKQEPK
jgi:hypothetical protein